MKYCESEKIYQLRRHVDPCNVRITKTTIRDETGEDTGKAGDAPTQRAGQTWLQLGDRSSRHFLVVIMKD